MRIARYKWDFLENDVFMQFFLNTKRMTRRLLGKRQIIAELSSSDSHIR